ncbi:peptide deformylase [Chlamydiifrater phoenicopteri]|uniref:peptide deformylase n=1 Tax=Chlamydiifrater phoenicopteri TaxID=2681469 RepID=UPI001BD01203|nr:peptide deformylase [Chlamydiifrater phoenicopteri]
MIRDITYYGNPLLRRKADPITDVSDAIKVLYRDMCETMEALKGVGLAAPQVGESLRMFVMCVEKETEEGELVFLKEPKVFINPVLSDPSKEKVSGREGCLSIPGLRGDVVRPEAITVEAIDLKGEVFKERYHGFLARIIMHENDHLNGVLYVDRMAEKDLLKLKKGLERIKRKYNGEGLPALSEKTA